MFNEVSLCRLIAMDTRCLSPCLHRPIWHKIQRKESAILKDPLTLSPRARFPKFVTFIRSKLCVHVSPEWRLPACRSASAHQFGQICVTKSHRTRRKLGFQRESRKPCDQNSRSVLNFRIWSCVRLRRGSTKGDPARWARREIRPA